VLAARGARNLDRGVESIEDHAIVSQARRQAYRIHIKAVVTAALLTALALLPG